MSEVKDPSSLPAENYCLARQPISDNSGSIVAYELLYRGDIAHTEANINNPNEATARVFTLAFMDIGVSSLAGKLPVFINMTDELLLKDDILPEPAQQVVLEVLEDISPTPEILKALKSLRQKGYRVALDDFVLNQKNRAFLPYADIIKLDIMSSSRAVLEKKVTLLRKLPKIILLAEKVETWDEFEFCKGLGFDLYQGYFFSKPETIEKKAISDSGMLSSQLLAELYKNEPDTLVLENLISRDPQLYYRIFKYINSARHSLSSEVKSLKHAIAMLGLQQLRSLVSMIVLAGSSKRGPSLIPSALIRAKMCQNLAVYRNIPMSETFFTVGLLSMLDSFFQRPLESILEELPLHSDILEALLEKKGHGGMFLQAAIAYEQGLWDELPELCIPIEVLTKSYVEAVVWVNSISGIATLY